MYTTNSVYIYVCVCVCIIYIFFLLFTWKSSKKIDSVPKNLLRCVADRQAVNWLLSLKLFLIQNTLADSTDKRYNTRNTGETEPRTQNKTEIKYWYKQGKLRRPLNQRSSQIRNHVNKRQVGKIRQSHTATKPYKLTEHLHNRTITQCLIFVNSIWNTYRWKVIDLIRLWLFLFRI